MSDRRPTRVLFVMRSAGFLRNFENAVRALLARGHAVTIATELGGTGQVTYRPLIEELRAAGVVFVVAPGRRREVHHRAAMQIRLALDYLRYLEPAYDDRPKLRRRAEGAVLAPLRPLVRQAAADGASARFLRQSLHALDAAAPVSPTVERFLDEHACDLLLVTPLVELGAPQTDWLRAARRRGIPTALAVASWDNLTVKGRIRERPDRVLVWNEPQREEAARLHALASERVVATGAHTYDHWFDWGPSRDRAGFCAEIGLRADRPIILYVCSSPFIAPGESEYVEAWLEALRRSGRAELRDAGVLVRPHPQHVAQWAGSRLGDLEQVAVWPARGADPVARSSREDFFDSIHHCAAVTGVNTSALIESSIMGRQVLTLLGDRYADTQRGTIHFEHLADADRGILSVAASPPEHHDQLVRAIAGDDGWQQRRARFLSLFVRPHGLDAPAALLFADAVDALQRAGGECAAAALGRGRRPAARIAELLWRWTPLRSASAAANTWARARAFRQPLTVAHARLGADPAATARAERVERVARRARALS
jgi:hypothetical protein